MTKDEMITAVSRKACIARKDAEAAVSAVFDTIFSALVSGEKVQIVGFGCFEVRTRAPRVGRNPRANTAVEIPAKRVPIFKAGKPLREEVGKQICLMGGEK